MKILITGSKGQLGNELEEIIRKGKACIGKVSDKIRNTIVVKKDIEELDITNLNKVKEVIINEKPDVVINCAADTNVDGCETNFDNAYKVNTLGPRNIAIACEEVGAKLVQISTDYVFDGIENISYKEIDIPNPQSIYGKTKLAGEKYVRDFCSKYFIVRTSWLYGEIGKNFVYTIMKLGNEKEKINVVNDQKGNPTNANDLAYHILKIIQTEEYGIYHCTGKGECTWYEFAKEIIRISGKDCIVNPCSSEEFKTIAKRPQYSSLDNMMLRCTIGDEMREWKEALEEFIKMVNK